MVWKCHLSLFQHLFLQLRLRSNINQAGTLSVWPLLVLFSTGLTWAADELGKQVTTDQYPKTMRTHRTYFQLQVYSQPKNILQETCIYVKLGTLRDQITSLTSQAKHYYKYDYWTIRNSFPTILITFKTNGQITVLQKANAGCNYTSTPSIVMI